MIHALGSIKCSWQKGVLRNHTRRATSVDQCEQDTAAALDVCSLVRAGLLSLHDTKGALAPGQLTCAEQPRDAGWLRCSSSGWSKHRNLVKFLFTDVRLASETASWAQSSYFNIPHTSSELTTGAGELEEKSELSAIPSYKSLLTA